MDVCDVIATPPPSHAMNHSAYHQCTAAVAASSLRLGYCQRDVTAAVVRVGRSPYYVLRDKSHCVLSSVMRLLIIEYAEHLAHARRVTRRPDGPRTRWFRLLYSSSNSVTCNFADRLNPDVLKVTSVGVVCLFSVFASNRTRRVTLNFIELFDKATASQTATDERLREQWTLLVQLLWFLSPCSVMCTLLCGPI